MIKKILTAILLFSLVFCVACNTNESVPKMNEDTHETSSQETQPKENPYYKKIPSDEMMRFLENEEEQCPIVDPNKINLFDAEFQHLGIMYSSRPTRKPSVEYVFLLGDKKIKIVFEAVQGYKKVDDSPMELLNDDLRYTNEEVHPDLWVYRYINSASYTYATRSDEFKNELISISFKVNEWWCSIEVNHGFPNNTSVAQRLLNKETASAQIDELFALFEGLLKT